jgi:hypothetical protein
MQRPQREPERKLVMATATEMKRELINHIAQQLKSYGYPVYISKDGTYGFYTDGERVVSFGGQWAFSVDFSGNYSTTAPRSCGTGWQIAKELHDINQYTAESFIKANAPRWAVGDAKVQYTTPEQHLKTYGASSGYTLA